MSTQEQITAYQEVRKTLVERLRRLEIAPALVDDMSVFQLMNLLWLMAGHVSYLGSQTTAPPNVSVFSSETFSSSHS